MPAPSCRRPCYPCPQPSSGRIPTGLVNVGWVRGFLNVGWLARVRRLLAQSCGLRECLLFLSWLSRCKPDAKRTGLSTLRVVHVLFEELGSLGNAGSAPGPPRPLRRIFRGRIIAKGAGRDVASAAHGLVGMAYTGSRKAKSKPET